jgi:glycosyltransferase involved in cell wall biosynthesis
MSDLSIISSSATPSLQPGEGADGVSPTPAFRATIIIPVYNECEALGATLCELARRGFHERYEILVVDDGSTDGSRNAVEAFTFVRLIKHTTNRGYGAALKTGIRNARTEKVVFMDGDGQHSPDGVEEVVRLLDEFSMVIGERGIDSRQDRSRLLGKRLIRVLGEYLVGQKLPDFNSGFRGFRKSARWRLLNMATNTRRFRFTLRLEREGPATFGSSATASKPRCWFSGSRCFLTRSKSFVLPAFCLAPEELDGACLASRWLVAFRIARC